MCTIDWGTTSSVYRRPRRSGQPAFSQAGYLVYCSGECGGENVGKKGQGGVGLAVRNSITRAARPPEFISDRLLKVTLELRGRAKAVTFVVAYAPTEPQNANNKHAFWTSLDRVVEEVPKHEQLFVLMDANARTGRREKGQVGSKDSKILGAYGRCTLNDNGELMLSFANNHDLALVNTFFSTPKGGNSPAHPPSPRIRPFLPPLPTVLRHQHRWSFCVLRLQHHIPRLLRRFWRFRREVSREGTLCRHYTLEPYNSFTQTEDTSDLQRNILIDRAWSVPRLE